MYKSTESDHVKMNLVYKLHRIRSFSTFQLQDFREFPPVSHFDAYVNRRHKILGFLNRSTYAMNVDWEGIFPLNIYGNFDIAS